MVSRPWYLSPAFLFRYVLVPDREPHPPRVHLYLRPPENTAQDRTKFDITLINWNSMWEAGPHTLRSSTQRVFRGVYGGCSKSKTAICVWSPGNPRHRYDAYAPLYHLLPAATLRSVGLPLLKRGLWPHWVHRHQLDTYLSPDFDVRLADAFSRHIWPLLNDRSARFAFTADDPIRMLSHHLDYWLPYIDVVAQRRMRLNGRCAPDKADNACEEDEEDERVERRLRRTSVSAVEGWAPLDG